MNSIEHFTEEGRFFFFTTPETDLINQQNMHFHLNETNFFDIPNHNCSNTLCKMLSSFPFKNTMLALFLISLGLLTVLGNILVLLAIFVDFHLRSPTHYLMGSLAIADLLLGTLVLPFSSTQLFLTVGHLVKGFAKSGLVSI